MSLKLYSVAELLTMGKTYVRKEMERLGKGIGTEFGTDFDLTLHAATRLLFGGQVAAQNLYDRLLPGTADAQGRDELAGVLGVTTAHAATPARGYAAFLAADIRSAFTLPAGTTFTIPAERFADGVSREFRTLQDVDSAGNTDMSAFYATASGTGIHKLRPATLDGVAAFGPGDLLVVSDGAGAAPWFVVVRSANRADESLELVSPVLSAMRGRSTEVLARLTRGAVVAVEAVEAGVAGNAPAARAQLSDLDGEPYVLLYGTSGGGDAVGEPDVDTERVVRLLEDTVACPPSFGNDQHWREIALATPGVLLDDVVVYRHVRGVGTIDLVCIGRSGSVRAPAFPDANLANVSWGSNSRFIGDVQAALVESWCRAQASYFDDIKAHSVQWDYRGNTFAEVGSATFFQSVCRVDVDISVAAGYGPDCGVAFDCIPSGRHVSRLYAARPGERVLDALRPGHRVWAAVGPSRSAGRHPFTTIVTEVLSIAPDRSYASIAPVSGLLPASLPITLDVGGQQIPYVGELELLVLRWGTAGPVTQGVIDAVHGYFDRLGPGSYTLAPKGPGYVQRFWPDQLATPEPGVELLRWPPEGRRWASSVRGSELRAEILRVAGVDSVELGRLSDALLDYDPAPLMTTALNGVLPRYALPKEFTSAP